MKRPEKARGARGRGRARRTRALGVEVRVSRRGSGRGHVISRAGTLVIKKEILPQRVIETQQMSIKTKSLSRQRKVQLYTTNRQMLSVVRKNYFANLYN